MTLREGLGSRSLLCGTPELHVRIVIVSAKTSFAATVLYSTHNQTSAKPSTLGGFFRTRA